MTSSSGNLVVDLALGALSWVGYVGSAWVLTSVLVEPVLTRRLLAAFLFFYAEVTVSGLLLSALGAFGSIVGWTICAAGAVVATGLWGRKRWRKRSRLSSSAVDWRAWRWAWLPLLLVGLTFAVALCLQLSLVIASAPKNRDSMTYHMARVAYYLQNGTLRAYAANFWAQLDHPKNSAIAMAYATLASARRAQFAQLVQFSSWLALVVANYDIARRVGASRAAALLSGLASGLAINVLLESNTTQNDLYQAALGAAGLSWAIAALQGNRTIAPILAGIAVGLALGTKSSFLVAFPALAATWLGLLAYHRRVGSLTKAEAVTASRRLALACTAGVLGLALPSGYWENWRRCGNPLGSPAVLESKVLSTHQGLGQWLHHGLVNALRFGLDSLQLSGLPESTVAADAMEQLRAAYLWLVQALGVDLASAPTLAPPFVVSAAGDFSAHEDFAHLGAWGFLVMFPIGLFALASKRARVIGLSFLVGGVVFWLAQAFSGVYDPWRGRYLVVLTALVAPAFALGCDAGFHLRSFRALLSGVVAVGCLSSINAIVSRRTAEFVPSVTCDWPCQVTLSTMDFRGVVEKIEQLVPREASLIVSLDGGYSEFPLFGEHLSRRLIPAPTAADVAEAVRSQGADFLVFNRSVKPLLGDCYLGGGVFLRSLRGAQEKRCRDVRPRVEDVQRVRDALEAYHRDVGAYPRSQGWDGFQSRWGNASPEWIQGLVPRYLDRLPVARRESERDWAMYVYKSDGRDYKLLVLASDDVEQVTHVLPEWVDSAGGGGYGPSTPGARSWQLVGP